MMASRGRRVRLAGLPLLLLVVAGVALGGCGEEKSREIASTGPSIPSSATEADPSLGATLAASTAVWDVSQWTIYGDNTESVYPGRSYGLLSNFNQKSLRYQKREYGINLDWDNARTGRHISFRRSGTSTAPLTYGEVLAIQVSGGGYLRYKEREYGINLDWSSTPVYEWEIDGGAFGSSVRGDPNSATVQSSGSSGVRVRLYNRTHGDYVLYGVRDYGINLKWYADEISGGSYPAVPFPPDLRSPSGEPGQALLAGTAFKTEIFHGGTDDELDWHIFITPDPLAQAALATHLLAHAKGAKCARRVLSACYPLRVEDLGQVWTEWMVMDGYDNQSRDELFYSADVGRVLGLERRSAWNYSDDAGEAQDNSGATAIPMDSKLINSRARVYLQGPLVNDSSHGFRIEIHPLDSVAYALDSSGNPVTVPPSGPGWPSKTMTWRVAAFTNATIHRIDGAEYVKKDRTTTWWLPLPGSPAPPSKIVGATRPPLLRFSVQETAPEFENYAVAHSVGGLDTRRPGSARYRDYGVKGASYALERDPTDGKTKLRVTVTMSKPDFWGGMFLREYRITAEEPRATR